MGHTSNVGLMAQKAEEYGSHDKTFTMKGRGVVRVLGSGGAEFFSHPVEEGDIDMIAIYRWTQSCLISTVDI